MGRDWVVGLVCGVVGGLVGSALVHLWSAPGVLPDGGTGVLLQCKVDLRTEDEGRYQSYGLRWVGCTTGEECLRKLERAGCVEPAWDGWRVYSTLTGLPPSPLEAVSTWDSEVWGP